MISKKLKALQEARNKVSQLEEAVEKERVKALAALPAQYGYDDVNAFIRAIKAANGVRTTSGKGSGKRKARAVINSETKKQVKALHQAGETGAAIAKKVGISVPSVQNIKKELGLTKSRKK